MAGKHVHAWVPQHAAMPQLRTYARHGPFWTSPPPSRSFHIFRRALLMSFPHDHLTRARRRTQGDSLPPDWFSWRKLWAFTGPGLLMSIAYIGGDVAV